MTTPLSDAQLDEIAERAQFAYDGGDPIQTAGYDVPALVAEIRRGRVDLAAARQAAVALKAGFDEANAELTTTRVAHMALAEAFDGVCGEREASARAEQDARALASRFFDGLERVHARVSGVCDFDAGECAPPEDPRWADELDRLNTFAGDVYRELEPVYAASGLDATAPSEREVAR